MTEAWLTYLCFFLSSALIYGVICLGLNLQWGMTGLFNVGVAGFVAVGAYVSAIVTTPATTTHLGGFDLPVAVGWLAAMAAGGAAALAVGAMTLRLRTDTLAITTFGVAVVVQLIALNAQTLTGGPFGIGLIPRNFAALQDRPLAFNLANLLVSGAVVATLYGVLERLARSPWGRVLRAIRADEVAAAALGKNPTRFRLQAFAGGGALMALGGAMQAHEVGFIAPANYLPTLTFQIWTMLIIGGAGRNRGALIGALLVWGLWSGSGALIAALVPPEAQARAGALQIAAIGVLLCTMLLARSRRA